MPKNQLVKNTKLLKDSIKKAIQHEALAPCSKEKGPFHHPIAKAIEDKKITFSAKEKGLIRESLHSAKLFINPENYSILHQYFVERRKSNDLLGNLYKTLSFSDFILRLFHKRFKEVYYDGRAVVLRDGTSYGGRNGKDFLQMIGTQKDKQEIYKDYLCLEESVLSTLVLPQATSIVIGTGSRSNEQEWDVAQEFDDSIDVATFSYPAAAEFRNGQTAHYDYLFIVKPEKEDENYRQQIARIKANLPLMNAARKIYGNTFAFEIKDNTDKRFITLNVNEQIYYLNKNAYIARTKNVLKSLLLAADQEMSKHGLGRTFQLKGLGLGAFSFSGKENSKKLEALYIQCLKSVLEDKSFQLKYINCINLINLPSDMDSKLKKGQIKKETTTSAIKLIRTCMDPTSKINKNKIGEIGGVVVCGDSGSKFGNEGNIGLQRSSSDDPAAQYSLLDPLILDVEANPALQNKDCIHLLANTKEIVINPIAKHNDQSETADKATLGQMKAWSMVAGFVGVFALIYLAGTGLIASIALTTGIMALGAIVFKRFLESGTNTIPQEKKPQPSMNNSKKNGKTFTPTRKAVDQKQKNDHFTQEEVKNLKRYLRRL